MAVDIKNAEVEKLASEAAELAGESKTQAIRTALEERSRRLKLHRGGRWEQKRTHALLARFRKICRRGDVGRTMTRAGKEAILGYGPEGFCHSGFLPPDRE
jgi:antitoxin VapB